MNTPKTTPPTAQELHLQTASINDLRSMAAQRGLPATGKADEIRARIEQHDAAPPAPAQQPSPPQQPQQPSPDADPGTRAAPLELGIDEEPAHGRRARKPLGGMTTKLSFPDAMKNPNFEYRWMNDDKGRISSALDAGYDFVKSNGSIYQQGAMLGTSELANCIRNRVGTKESHEPLYAYLMAIPREWYDEDQEKRCVTWTKRKNRSNRDTSKHRTPNRKPCISPATG